MRLSLPCRACTRTVCLRYWCMLHVLFICFVAADSIVVVDGRDALSLHGLFSQCVTFTCYQLLQSQVSVCIMPDSRVRTAPWSKPFSARDISRWSSPRRRFRLAYVTFRSVLPVVCFHWFYDLFVVMSPCLLKCTRSGSRILRVKRERWCLRVKACKTFEMYTVPYVTTTMPV